MMSHGLSVATKACSPTEQGARTVGSAAGHTRRESLGGARSALTAARQERHHDPLPDFDVTYCGAGAFDDACGLVPEQHGDRPHTVTFDNRQIRMTQPRGLDADEQLMLTRRSEIEFNDGQRPRLGVTAGAPMRLRTAPRILITSWHSRRSECLHDGQREDLTANDFPVHWPVLTRWTDNDMFGHHNNAVFYELVDTAINSWINVRLDIDPLTAPLTISIFR
jgi:hypothetical protein